MKIAFFEIEDWEREYIQKEFIKNGLKGHELKFYKDELTADNFKEVCSYDIISVFIYSKINKKILDKLGRLKLIATRSTGFEHIDLEECKKRGIAVCNVPFYGENTVAEHTFALLLALSRKIPESFNRTIRGDFNVDGLRGFDLKGKTIGVVGAGHIGLHVIRIAHGFEMNILAYDINKNKEVAKRLGFRYVPLDYLLKNSDIISIHTPLNKYTYHLINKKNIKSIKKGAFVINTARGGIIETDALVKALYEGHLGGAGLDVLEEEDLVKEEIQLLSKKFLKRRLEIGLKNKILLRFDNVIVTPHNAFNSKEALQRILDTAIENIRQFIKGKCINKVGQMGAAG